MGEQATENEADDDIVPFYYGQSGGFKSWISNLENSKDLLFFFRFQINENVFHCGVMLGLSQPKMKKKKPTDKQSTNET